MNERFLNQPEPELLMDHANQPPKIVNVVMPISETPVKPLTVDSVNKDIHKIINLLKENLLYCFLLSLDIKYGIEYLNGVYMNLINIILKDIQKSGYNCMFFNDSSFDYDSCKIIRLDGQVLELGEPFTGNYKNLTDYNEKDLKKIFAGLETFYWQDTKESFFDNWGNTNGKKWNDIELWYSEDLSLKKIRKKKLSKN